MPKSNQKRPVNEKAIAIITEGASSDAPPMPADVEVSISGLLAQLKIIEKRALMPRVDIVPECVELGRDATYGINIRRYIIGRILELLVIRKYGAGDVEKAADDMGIGLSTARQYEDVVRFYGFQTCLELTTAPFVRYSHLRIAMKTDNRETAIKLLAWVSENQKSTTALTEAIYGNIVIEDPEDEEAKPSEVKLFDLDRAKVEGYNVEEGTITMFVGWDPTMAVIPFQYLHLIAKVPAEAKPKGPPRIDMQPGTPAPAEDEIEVENPAPRYRPVDEDGALIEDAIIEYEG